MTSKSTILKEMIFLCNQKNLKVGGIDKNIVIPDEVIMSKILLIRGKNVMIDSYLASLYGIPTKRLNEKVKRNVKRFPAHFMFQLTQEEKDTVVAICDHRKKLKYSPFLPYVFTEHGTAMLANVLNSDRSIQASIRIIDFIINLLLSAVYPVLYQKYFPCLLYQR